VAIALAIGIFAWDDFLRLTADEQNRSALAWIYDSDAAPGQTLAGRATLELGDIEGVAVYDWTRRDEPDASVEKLGDVWFGERHADPTQNFTFTVPADAEPGATLDLDIELLRVNGGSIDLRHRVALVSRGVSALRRTGKGILALALLAALAAAVFALKRRALKRSGEESALWSVPVVVIGGLSFVPLVEQAVRLHAWWFYGFALGASAVASFAIAERLNRRVGLALYKAVPMLVDMAAHDAFREAAVTAPIRPVDELENAWAAVGLIVRRAGRDLIVTGPGGRIAIVSVPRSESVGGEPLLFRASDPDYADLLVAAASDVLGEMRFA